MLDTLIREIPKAELHVHIEGTLEPELMFKMAKRNGLTLSFDSVQEVREAYEFTDLQSFLDLYHKSMEVLLYQQDFYEMTWAYLVRARMQNVRHAEIFFDPQAHTCRGVPFETVITGIYRALRDARWQLGISAKLIMCFLRHLSAESANETLQQALRYKDWIVGVGLDSSEAGNPPDKFASAFSNARKEGFLTVAHAGEEGPTEYIWQALEKLKVSRIDHGVRCIEDEGLVEKLRAAHVPLTICPLSNVNLHVFNSLTEHNLKQLFDLGLCVTVNSDDPAYFGGYITENLLAVQRTLHMDSQDIYCLVRNSFQASFLSREEKQRLLNELKRFCNLGGVSIAGQERIGDT